MRVVERHVGAAVHAFFDGRWSLFLAGRVSTRGREDFRRRLSGPVEVKREFCTPVDGLSDGELYDLLVSLGAPDGCVLVKDGLVEDELTSLRSALRRVCVSREGALISCIPGRLAFLQCDCGRTRLLLRAVPRPQSANEPSTHDEGTNR